MKLSEPVGGRCIGDPAPAEITFGVVTAAGAVYSPDKSLVLCCCTTIDNQDAAAQ